MIDLHTHSAFSDGTDTPTEIIEQAHKIGLSAIALTDHDVVDGLDEFQIAAKKYPDIKAINGCELAVFYPNIDMEIIALDIKDIEAFKARQIMLEKIRDDANIERLDILKNHGIDLTWEDVSIDSNGEKCRLIGRPHFALAMIKKGYVSNANEAFAKYLGEGGVAYIDRKNPPVRETIEFINSHSAMSILAHPVLTKQQDDNLFDLLKELKGFGLQGMECYHCDHNDKLTAQYLDFASKLDLKVSGGSDYHGSIRPERGLGFIHDNKTIPDNVYEKLFFGREICKEASSLYKFKKDTNSY